MIYVVDANNPTWSWSIIFVVEAEDRIEAIKKVRDLKGHQWDTNIQIASQHDNALVPIQVHYM